MLRKHPCPLHLFIRLSSPKCEESVAPISHLQLKMKTPTKLTLLCLALCLHFSNAVLTDCVVQAFGSGLSGKGIRVEVRSNGINCPGNPTLNNPVNQAKFDDFGEAEVPLRLHVDQSGVCMVALSVWVTLPYNCKSLERSARSATWQGLTGGNGSCRALEQKCDVVSTAAVPYIDMYCRTPRNQVFEGQTQEMMLKWNFPSPNDKC